MKDKIFHETIEQIVEKEDPYGILLVGSLSRMSELNLEKARDVDIFVITGKEEFERRVENIDGLEFDISYIPIELLNEAIEKRLSSLISVLRKNKILYKSKQNTLNNVLEMIKSIYEEGPQKLTKSDIDYQRFKLTQSYFTLESRRKDSLNFNFLKGVFLQELLICYFTLNNIWMPPDKRMLSSVEDRTLKLLLDKYLESSNIYNIENELDSLSKLLEFVLEPFDGKLEFWEKDIFPFDFL